MQQTLDYRFDEMCAMADDDAMQLEAFMRMPFFSYLTMLERKRDEWKKMQADAAKLKTKSKRK